MNIQPLNAGQYTKSISVFQKTETPRTLHQSVSGGPRRLLNSVQMRGEFLHKMSFWNSAYNLLNHLSCLEDHECRNAAYSKFHRRLRISIDIHFCHLELAVIFFGKFFYHWRNHFARSTPDRPEINKNWFIGFQDFCLKICVIHVNWFH